MYWFISDNREAVIQVLSNAQGLVGDALQEIQEVIINIVSMDLDIMTNCYLHCWLIMAAKDSSFSLSFFRFKISDIVCIISGKILAKN